jgi:hypothetical protein
MGGYCSGKTYDFGEFTGENNMYTFFCLLGDSWGIYPLSLSPIA